MADDIKQVYTKEDKQLLADRVKRAVEELNRATADCYKAGLLVQVAQVPISLAGETKFTEHVFEHICYSAKEQTGGGSPV